MDEYTLIVGASGGLGQALARKFNKEGSGLILTGRKLTKLEKIFTNFKNCHLYQVDITSKEEVDNLFKQISDKGLKIKNIINTAGIGLFGPVESYSEKESRDVIEVNLLGAIYVSQQGFMELKEKGGSMVNIISTAGLVGKAGESVYCASKWGLRGFLEALRQEAAGTGVKILAVYPGGIKTSFFNKAYGDTYDNTNFMEPAELAELIYQNIKNYQTLEVSDLVIKRK
jgi:short-subunit dehydrogenase